MILCNIKICVELKSGRFLYHVKLKVCFDIIYRLLLEGGVYDNLNFILKHHVTYYKGKLLLYTDILHWNCNYRNIKSLEKQNIPTVIPRL